MSHMDVHDRPDLVESASICYDDVKAVFAQNDTWDVHLFILFADGEGYFTVAMVNARKPSKTATLSADELREALEDGFPDDTGEFRTMGEALATIVQYGTLRTENPELLALFGSVEEAEKVARMSKYARKSFLRDKGVTLDEYLAGLSKDARNAYHSATIW